MLHASFSSVFARKWRRIVLALGVLLALSPTAANAQRPGLGDEVCKEVFGIGELNVQVWIDDPPEPFVVGGQFQVAIDDAEDLVAYLEDDPGELTWYQGTFSLIAFPGSDAPLPGDLSWAPCSSRWELSRQGLEVTIESFCESTLVPEPDEGDEIYEFLVREEMAAVNFPGTHFECGRLFLDGLWDALAEPPGTEEDSVTVAGKICNCGAQQRRIIQPF